MTTLTTIQSGRCLRSGAAVGLIAEEQILDNGSSTGMSTTARMSQTRPMPHIIPAIPP
jgi:hypothetical protein